DLRADHRRAARAARQGPPYRPRARAPSEPAAAEHGRPAGSLPEGPGPRDEHGPAPLGAAREVPGAGRGPQQDPGEAVHAARDRDQDRRGDPVTATLPVYTKKDFQTDQEV